MGKRVNYELTPKAEKYLKHKGTITDPDMAYDTMREERERYAYIEQNILLQVQSGHISTGKAKELLQEDIEKQIAEAKEEVRQEIIDKKISKKELYIRGLEDDAIEFVKS